MRRRNNDMQEEVTLFVGSCRLIILNYHRQIDYAFRTIQLTEKTIKTYVVSESDESKIGSKGTKSMMKNGSIELQKLTNHQYQYILTTAMRPKLLLFRRDTNTAEYLKELKAPDIKLKENETINIVAIATEEQGLGKYINGFIFSQQEDAIDFYEGLNHAIGFQLYKQILPPSLPFNFKINRRIGDILNGQCVIDPIQFLQGKQEEEEINFFVELLKYFKNQTLFNFRTNLFELKLCFKIIDETSINFACRFIGPLQNRTQKLTVSDCELTSNMFGQILLSVPHRLIEQLVNLQVLDMSCNNLNDDVFTTLGNLLKYSKMLHVLDLSFNKIAFEKEGIIHSFLISITRFKMQLNLAANSIKNALVIAKYFINVQGDLPVESLNLYDNPFKPNHLSIIVKSYLERKQANPAYLLQLKIGELQLEDPSAFQFLTKEYRDKQPTALSVPITLSRHPFRKQGREVGMTKQEVDQSSIIDDLLKKYFAQIYLGNFYRRKQLKDELLRLGVRQEQLACQSKELNQKKIEQQTFLICRMQNCLNFNVHPSKILSGLNQSLKYARLKGITGPGINCLAEIKFRIEQSLQKLEKEGNLGKFYRQSFYSKKKRFASLCEQDLNSQYFRSFNFRMLAEASQTELLQLIKKEEGTKDPDGFVILNYLLLTQSPKKWDHILLNACLGDPRLASSKAVREAQTNPIKFHQSQRIVSAGLMPKKSMVEIAASYGIESYRFNRNFIQSCLSSSGYTGLLSESKYDVEQEKSIMAMIQVFNNFMQILYYSPEEISQQAILYANTIAEYLMDRQTEKDNDFKCLLAEQLFIRIITFYDSQKHRPLKRGILLTICEFLLRRIAVDDELVFRIIAHLVKTDSYQQNELNIHCSVSKIPWEGKIDWKVKDMNAVKEILLSRGKMKISVADISNQKLQVMIEVDQLATVSAVWEEVKKNMLKISEFTNINPNQLDYYWLCGSKDSRQSWQFKYLPSYEHIGKLIFQDQFERKFFIRRAIYPPQYHQTSFLKETKYEDLLCLFVQAKQSFRESAFMILADDPEMMKVKMTVEIIWIESLILQELMLGALRRQDDEESLKKYLDERENIISECMGKIYLKYLPINTVLSEESRNGVVTQLRAKKNQPIPKIISQTIKERIINFVSRLGVCCFTTTISDSKNAFFLYANNYSFCFLDRTTAPVTTIKIEFKNLLWLQLVGGEKRGIKIDAIESIENDKLNRRTFTVSGEVVWLAQCYSLLISICQIRIQYPPKLLFITEDSKNGICSSERCVCEEKSLIKSPLQINKLMSFTLLRSQRKMGQDQSPQVMSPMKAREPTHNQMKLADKKEEKRPVEISNPLQELKLSESRTNELKNKETEIEKIEKPQQSQNREQNAKEEQKQLPKPVVDKKKESNIILPIPSIPERSSESSAHRISQNNLQIEQILQNANQNDGNEVVTINRGSIKNPAARRRTRNR